MIVTDPNTRLNRTWAWLCRNYLLALLITWIVIIAAALAAALFLMPGCGAVKSVNPFNWFHSSPSAPKPNPHDKSGSYEALIRMAYWAFSPGIGMVILGSLGGALAKAYMPLLSGFCSALSHTGFVILWIGLGCAAAPWALEYGGKPAMWASLSLGVVIAGLWIWGHRRKIARGKLKELTQ